MKKLLLFVVVFMQAACVEDASNQPNEARTGPVASSEDFRVAAGSGWKGHLTYLDYSSESVSKIPVEVEIYEPDGRTLVYAVKYPGEAQYNSREKIRFSRDGRKLDGNLLIARNRNDAGDLVLVTGFRGEDNNRPADIRVTYEISVNSFSVSKEVKFDGENDYFLRNRYSLTR